MRSLILALVCVTVCFVTPVAADPLPEKVTVATWNLEWFYDNYTSDNSFDVPKEQSPPSREEWEWKLTVAAEAIAKLDATILCLQEVESRKVIQQLVKRLREKHKIDYRVAFIEGTDFFTEQDVCVLAQSGLVEYARKEQSKEMFKSKEFYDLNKHIFCNFEWGEGADKVKLTLLNIHLRAQPEKTDLRIRQAKLAHHYLAEKIKSGENVIVIGDTNTEYPFEDTKPESDIAIHRGWETPEKNDDLFDCHEMLKPEDRPTHIIHKQFDRIFISEPMRAAVEGKKSLVLSAVTNRKELNTRGKEQDADHWNIYYKIPQEERDVSDHFPIVAEFLVK